MDTTIIAAIAAGLALIVREAIGAWRDSRKPIFTEDQYERLDALFVHKLNNHEMTLIAKYGLIEHPLRWRRDE